MADIKWSAFPATAAAAASGDTLVGLHLGVNSQFDISASPVALAMTQWDANVNLSANNTLNGYTTTVTATATTILTVGSTYFQYFTGTLTQTVTMPDVSTLALGQSFYIVNNSTDVVTVESSGGNTIQAMGADTSLFITCILTSGTTAASWNATYMSETSGIAGGSNTEIQYNDNGFLNGDSGFTTNGAGSLTITGDLSVDNLNLNGNTLSSTDTGGDINLTPDTTGNIVLDGVNWSSGLSDGELFVGATGNVPQIASLTAGTGISILNAAGSITISSSASGLLWSTDATGTIAADIDNGYVCAAAGATTITLPATAPIGSAVIIEGLGAGGWVLTANTGQTIQIGAGVTSSGGTLTSAAATDNVTVICIVANTTWRVQTTNSAGLIIA